MDDTATRLRERLLKVLFAAVDGRGEEVADEIIGISTRLEDYDEERYLRLTGQMIARYAANDTLSEGRVVLEIVRIATACDMLASGKRRACCFDRSGMYSKGNMGAPLAAE